MYSCRERAETHTCFTSALFIFKFQLYYRRWRRTNTTDEWRGGRRGEGRKKQREGRGGDDKEPDKFSEVQTCSTEERQIEIERKTGWSCDKSDDREENDSARTWQWLWPPIPHPGPVQHRQNPVRTSWGELSGPDFLQLWKLLHLEIKTRSYSLFSTASLQWLSFVMNS